MNKLEKRIVAIIIVVQAILFIVGKLNNYSMWITFLPTIIITILLLISILYPIFVTLFRAIQAIFIAIKSRQQKIFTNNLNKLKHYD